MGSLSIDDKTPALQHYRAVGEVMKLESSGPLVDFNSLVEEVYQDSTFPKPFILVDGPSGVGKTQLVYGLRRNVHHLILDCLGDTAQPIYMAHERRSAIFRQALQSDLIVVNDSFGTLSLLAFPVPLQLPAFVASLLGHSPAERITVAELKTFVDRMIREQLPVFCLDETPSIAKYGKGFIGLARNLFRVTGLVVVMMGTDRWALIVQLPTL